MDLPFLARITGALFAGLMAATALAAEPPPAAAPTPNAADCGKHGTMDVNKMKERGAKVFAMVDTNGDGEITDIEFLAAETPRGGGHRMRHGKGHHGPRMTQAQQQTFEADLFKALDTDGNGELSAAEFAKVHETMQTMMKKNAFVRLDSDGDGVLGKDEFPPFPQRMAAMDTDGDGTVTRDEMSAAKQAPPVKTPN